MKSNMGFFSRFALMNALPPLVALPAPRELEHVAEPKMERAPRTRRVRGGSTKVNKKPFTRKKNRKAAPYVKLNYRRSDPRHLQHAKFCRNPDCACRDAKVAA